MNNSSKLTVEFPDINLGRPDRSIFFNKKYCINNQLPRIYSNLVVLGPIIFSGAYLDMNYFSYSIKNEFDRKYESIFMCIMFLWATLVYLKCSYTVSAQTRIETFTNTNDTAMAKEIVNIQYNRFSNYCEFCKGKKFERTSHCRQCGFCVLRRDHHCPGLGMCVGYHNTQLFCNLTFIMTPSAGTYLINLVRFYNNRKQIKEDFPELHISFLVKIWMVVSTVLIILCITNSIPLFLQQIFYTYNDIPYHEYTKKPNLESSWAVCVSRNEDSMYNPYNKGFLHNFNNIIGPTVLHLFFPLPKYNESYDIVENKDCFTPIYPPHTFQVHNFMKENEYPDFEDHWKEQLMAMDPDVFIQLAKTNYEGKMII